MMIYDKDSTKIINDKDIKMCIDIERHNTLLIEQEKAISSIEIKVDNILISVIEIKEYIKLQKEMPKVFQIGVSIMGVLMTALGVFIGFKIWN